MSEKTNFMDLTRTMLCSQTAFMEKRIVSQKYRKVFKDTALSFISASSRFSDKGNYGILSFRNELILIKSGILNGKPGYFKSMFDEQHNYKLLAIEMAEDVVNSVIARFIEGDSRTYLGLFKTIQEIR